MRSHADPMVAGPLGAVLMLGAGLALLTHPTEARAAGMALALFASLLAATVVAIRTRGRPFWLGYALFGWAYFMMALEPQAESPYSGQSSPPLEPSLLT